jgi:hypothetical protein
MGMLDTSTGLLKALPEKPALSRVGSEAENLSARNRQRSIVAESYGSYGSYGANGGSSFNFTGSGFAIGAPRDRDEAESIDMESSNGMRSGLASPSTSVSSSGESRGAFDGYNGNRAGFGIGAGGGREDY